MWINKIIITEKGTSVKGNDSAKNRLITDDVAVFLRRNQNYARGPRQVLHVARNVDNDWIYDNFTLLLR